LLTYVNKVEPKNAEGKAKSIIIDNSFQFIYLFQILIRCKDVPLKAGTFKGPITVETGKLQ
jgi:hypothetical protein